MIVSVTSVLGWLIRSLQFFNGILLCALGGWAIDQYENSGALGYSVAVGALSVIYVLFVILINNWSSHLVVAGFIYFFECFFAILFFVGFLVTNVVFSDDECVLTGNDIGPCRGELSVIGWTAIGFVLFTLSSFILLFSTIVPLILISGSEALWKSQHNLFSSDSLFMIYKPVSNVYKKEDIEANKSTANAVTTDKEVNNETSNDNIIDSSGNHSIADDPIDIVLEDEYNRV